MRHTDRLKGQAVLTFKSCLSGLRKFEAFSVMSAMVLLVWSDVTLGQKPTPTIDICIFCTGTGCPCVGDCNGDDKVTIDDLLTMVNVALGDAPVSRCLIGDDDGNQMISIDEILLAIQYAQQGCPDTPGYCSECSCQFVRGTGTVSVRGAVPSCTEPCEWLCARFDACGGVVSASCISSGPPG